MSYRNHQPFSSFEHPTYLKTSYVDDLASKLSSATTLSYVALSIALGYFTLLYMQLLSVSPVDIMSCIMPSKLIFLLDSFISGSKDMQSGGAVKSTDDVAKGQALRRILGLGVDGILGKLNLVRNGPGYSRVVKVDHEGAPPGLGNWDNSCYQNSVIQVRLDSYLTVCG
jgi:ubiquitin carboxyl-terminal hydrolase 1